MSDLTSDDLDCLRAVYAGYDHGMYDPKVAMLLAEVDESRARVVGGTDGPDQGDPAAWAHPDEEEETNVRRALACAHSPEEAVSGWPTVAGVLAVEVERLRALVRAPGAVAAAPPGEPYQWAVEGPDVRTFDMEDDAREFAESWNATQEEGLLPVLVFPLYRAPVAAAPPGDECAEVVTLCGSTRFKDAFHAENQRLTMEGHLVISLGVFGHTDLPDYDWTTDASDLKRRLDRLHFQKIDMADRVHVVAPGGYVGESTRREIAYAEQHGKTVTWSDPDAHRPPAPVAGDVAAAAADLDTVMHADRDEAPTTWLHAVRALQDRRNAGWRLVPPVPPTGHEDETAVERARNIDWLVDQRIDWDLTGVPHVVMTRENWDALVAAARGPRTPDPGAGQ